MKNMPPISQHESSMRSRFTNSWEEEKIEFLKPYKFTIAFENRSHPGYTTEKLIHAMAAHSIPIYWGNPLVGAEFNPKSFINCHDYFNFDAVIDHVIEVDKDDDLYHQYLREPYFRENKEPDYLNEGTILDRFETIFTHKKAYVNKNKIIDTAKRYHNYIGQAWQKCAIETKRRLGLPTYKYMMRPKD